jgi:hypothetical protein
MTVEILSFDDPATQAWWRVGRYADATAPGGRRVCGAECGICMRRGSDENSPLAAPVGVTRQAASHAAASWPALWQSRQRASYVSSAPTTIVSPE